MSDQAKEIQALRQIISECASALGNGSGMSADCSLDFMRLLPDEIRAELASLAPAASGAAPALPQADGRQCLNGVWMDAFTTQQMTAFGTRQFSAGREFEGERLDALASREASSATLKDEEIASACSEIYASDYPTSATYDLAIGRAVLALASPQVAPAPDKQRIITLDQIDAESKTRYGGKKNEWPTRSAFAVGACWMQVKLEKLAAPVQVAPGLTDKEIYALWLECEIPTEANNHTTGPVPFARALLALAAPMQTGAAADDARDACTWTYDEDCCGYHTACGNTFVFDAGGVEDNRARYCCYCGKSITPAAKPAEEQGS